MRSAERGRVRIRGEVRGREERVEDERDLDPVVRAVAREPRRRPVEQVHEDGRLRRLHLVLGQPDRSDAELLGLDLEQEVEVRELGIERAVACEQRIRVAIAAGAHALEQLAGAQLRRVLAQVRVDHQHEARFVEVRADQQRDLVDRRRPPARARASRRARADRSRVRTTCRQAKALRPRRARPAPAGAPPRTARASAAATRPTSSPSCARTFSVDRVGRSAVGELERRTALDDRALEQSARSRRGEQRARPCRRRPTRRTP